jgi:hypothetical protein
MTHTSGRHRIGNQCIDGRHHRLARRLPLSRCAAGNPRNLDALVNVCTECLVIRNEDSMNTRSTNTRAAAAAALLATLAMTGLILSACGKASTSCSGQCGPPFKLAVVFKPDTPLAEASAALKRCALKQDVLGVSALASTAPGLRASVSTGHIGMPVDQPLLSCLMTDPAVESAGWPD